MTSFNVYLILMLDKIVCILFVASIISIVIFLAVIIGLLITNAEPDAFTSEINFLQKIKRYVMPFCILVNILLVIVPTTTEMAVILTVPKIINSEITQKLPAEIQKLLDSIFSNKN